MIRIMHNDKMNVFDCMIVCFYIMCNQTVSFTINSNCLIHTQYLDSRTNMYIIYTFNLLQNPFRG